MEGGSLRRMIVGRGRALLFVVVVVVVVVEEERAGRWPLESARIALLNVLWSSFPLA